MTYIYDRFETNPIHEAEREESKGALRYAVYGCTRHDYYASDGRGGGVCVDCGAYIGPDEL